MERLYFIKDIKKSNLSVKKFSGEKDYIATADVENAKIVSSSKVDFEHKPSRANVVCNVGDIIFAKMKDTIKVLEIDNDNKDFIYSTGFYCFRDERLIPKYLKYFLMSPFFNQLKDKLSCGSTMKAINDTNLSKISIPLYDKTKQGFICKEIETIFRIILNLKHEIKLYDELIESKFDEMFGDYTNNEKNIDKCKFGDLITYLSDYNSNGSYKSLADNVTMKSSPDYALMVRTIDLENNNFVDDVKYINKKEYEFLSKSKIFGGELIMNKIGSAGKIYEMPFLKRPVSLGMNQFVIRCDNSNMKYIYYYLSTSFGKAQIEKRVKGAVTKTITKDAVREIPFLNPPIELQNKFGSFVDTISKIKFNCEGRINIFKELLNKKMEEYFN